MSNQRELSSIGTALVQNGAAGQSYERAEIRHTLGKKRRW